MHTDLDFFYAAHIYRAIGFWMYSIDFIQGGSARTYEGVYILVSLGVSFFFRIHICSRTLN
jgi:hypothetical protein